MGIRFHGPSLDAAPVELAPAAKVSISCSQGARHFEKIIFSGGLLAMLLVADSHGGSATRQFYDDDPLAREPATQDASKVQAWEIDLFYDLALNLFTRPGDPAPDVRARNINTIDEVPDSSWFTNRILARPVSLEEAARGPLTGTGPAAGTWTVTVQKADSLGSPLSRQGRDCFVPSMPRLPEARRCHPGREQDLLDARYWQVKTPAVGPTDHGVSRRRRSPPLGKRRTMRRATSRM